MTYKILSSWAGLLVRCGRKWSSDAFYNCPAANMSNEGRYAGRELQNVYYDHSLDHKLEIIDMACGGSRNRWVLQSQGRTQAEHTTVTAQSIHPIQT
jgi:hypothetical protein